MRVRFLFVLLSLVLLSTNMEARRIIIRRLEDLEHALTFDGCRLLIKGSIDLKGTTLTLPIYSKLVFKNGSLKNGYLIGTETSIANTSKNIFHNCMIQGSWKLDYACSTLFDDDLEAIDLLKNLSCLSSYLRLSSKRSYIIFAQGEHIKAEVIEAEGKEKPSIVFHTINPNVPGIVLIGNDVRLRNLIIKDDYDVKNDAKYGTNNPTIGNTIDVRGLNNIVETLNIDGCDFRGGTSSSWVASSHVKNCLVKNCTFNGFMADHGVYCSMKTETFKVENCIINDVTYVNGLFKVRTSDKFHLFNIANVTAHNINGYLATISLLETRDAEIAFKYITVTRDSGNNSIFYGFCINDETKSLRGDYYNARCISFCNCFFGYGYDSNPIIYAGAGNRVCAKEIKYDHVKSIGSNFGGGNTDKLSISDCQFDECCGENGIYLCTRRMLLEKSTLNSNNRSNCLFLVNYENEYMQSLTLQNVDINANTNTIVSIMGGKQVDLCVKDCKITNKTSELFKSLKTCNVVVKD